MSKFSAQFKNPVFSMLLRRFSRSIFVKRFVSSTPRSVLQRSAQVQPQSAIETSKLVGASSQNAVSVNEATTQVPTIEQQHLQQHTRHSTLHELPEIVAKKSFVEYFGKI
jgi:hypothetical protein